VRDRPKNTAQPGDNSNGETQPAHDQVIERHRRIQAHFDKVLPVPLEKPSTGPLKLTGNALHFLRTHVIREFINRAALSSEEKRYLGSGGSSKSFLIVEHAKSYQEAIGWAVGEFADLLVQAVLGRTRQRDISETARRAVWKEALRFADMLAEESPWTSWEEKAGTPIVSNYEDCILDDQDRASFRQRLLSYRWEWLEESDRRIKVRLVLAGAREEVKRVEPRRREIAKMMFANPHASALELCRMIDSINEAALSRAQEVPCPVPDLLMKRGLRLWADAFGRNHNHETQRMQEYLSKIRKEFGFSLLT